MEYRGMKKHDFTEAIKTQVKKLEGAASTLERFIKQIDSNSFQTVEQIVAKPFHYDLTEPNYLYVIRTKLTDSAKLKKLFSEFKEKNKETHKLSSVNPSSTKQFNGVLYVGSSASLNTRMSQHLGRSGQRVYSLQLSAWKPVELETISIEILPITEQFTEVLYQLENSLWDFYKPLFGKKGTNVNSSHKQ